MDRNILRQYLSGLAGANNRFLLENSRALGNLPQNIVYNGLVYTLNLRENAFINQFGHRIDASAAPAFITEARAFEQQNLAIMDISTASSDNGNSRGGQEVPLEGPSGLVLINNPGLSTTSIIIDWDAPVSYIPDSYKIYRSTLVGGPYLEAGTVGDPEITLFTNTGLSSGITYFYYVKAIKGGKESLSSETLNLATLSAEPPLVGITAPSGLTASGIAQTQLRLSWTDNSTNESGFFVYQSFDNLEYTPIFAVGAGVTSANVKPLVENTLYYYKVNAYGVGSTSAFSNTISVRTLPNIPTAPSNLSLLVGGTSQIRVSWTDNSTNEQFFNVQRSTDGTSYPFGITLPAGSTTYLNTGLSAGQTYWYRVNAQNTGGTSAFAGPSFAQTLPLAPTAPSNLRFNSRTASRLGLEWNDNSSNETGFVIDYSTAGVTYIQLDTVGPNIVAYDAIGLSSGSTYFFRVAAFNSGGTSSFSGVTSWQTLPLPPSVPTGFTAIVGSSANINLSWNDVANETGYELYRSLNGSSYTLLTTLGAGVTVFNNTGLNAETTYWYRLNAFNIGGTSDFTSAINATTLPAIPAVPSFTSISGTTNSITLNWNNVANETGYNLYRSTTLAGTYTGITTLGANVTTFVNTGLSSGTTFFYKIDAFNSGGTSALSGATSFVTLAAGTTPSAPTGFTAIDAGTNSVTLQWNDTSTTEDGFVIYYREITQTPPEEQRANFAAFAWNWPRVDAGYQWTYQWSAYGSTSGPESGSTYNYYTSSEDLGNTNWFGLQSGAAKPAWLNVLSGITDPFGGTGAFILNAQGLTTSQFLRYGQYVGGLPAGKTYIMSMYINTSGTTTNWVTYSQWQAAFASAVGITMRQILPIGASAAVGSIAPTVNFVSGQTGWQRFAWEFYAYPETKATGVGGSAVAGLTWENFRSYVMERTFSAGVTANIYLYGLQIEEA